MADKPERKLRTDASGISAWVDAYWGDNNEGFDSNGNDLTKKPEKFKHLQHLSSFATIAYYVNNNSPSAHINFFGTNYTHMSNAVEKATQLIFKLLEMKFESGSPETFTVGHAEFIKANNEVGLFKNTDITDTVVSDYNNLVNSCSHFIPVFKDNDKTLKNIKEINNDETIVAHHAEIVGQFGDAEHKCALDLKNIRMLNRRTVEVSSGTWEEVQGSKSGNLSNRIKDREDLFYARNDMLIKTGKVGALAAGGIYCLGSIAGGIFLPALGLIPIYYIGKHWLPQFAESFGKLLGTRARMMKDVREQKRIEAAEYFLQSGGKVRFKDRILGRMPKFYQEKLKKQLKTMGLFHGADNLAEETARGIGQAGTYDGSEKMVPADNLAYLQNMMSDCEKSIGGLQTIPNEIDDKTKFNKRNLESISIIQDLRNYAEKLKSIGDTLPNDSQKDALYSSYCDKVFKLVDDMMFNQEYGENVKGALDEFLDDKTVKEIIEKDKDGGHFFKRLNNIGRFLSQEKLPVSIKGHSDQVNLLSAPKDVHGLDLLGLTAFDAATVKASYLKISGATKDANVEALIDKIYALNKNDGTNFAAVETEINTIANEQVKTYLLDRLKNKEYSTKFDSSFIETRSESTKELPTVKGVRLSEALAEMYMIKPSDNNGGVYYPRDEWGKIYSEVGNTRISLDDINKAIERIDDENVKTAIIGIKDEQLGKINNEFTFLMKAKGTKGIKDELEKGTWVLYASNFKNDEGKDGAVINDASMNYSEPGLKNASDFYYNSLSKLPNVTFKEDFLYYKLNNHMYLKFMDEAKRIKDSVPSVEDIQKYLKAVNAAPYFTEAQRSFFRNEMAMVFDSALDNSIELLGATLMTEEGKKITDIANKLGLPISNGGLKELQVDKKLKDKCNYLNNCADFATILEMKSGSNGYAWIDTEFKFVRHVLFKDGKMRDENDKLRVFMGKIGNIPKNEYNLSGSIFKPSVAETPGFDSGKTFQSIRDALKYIEFWKSKLSTSITENDKDELVAAYLVLKNKAVSLLHQFMDQYKSQLLTNYAGKTFDNIVVNQTAKAAILEVTSKWNQLLGEIDNAISTAFTTGAPAENKAKATDAITRYTGDASKWISGPYGMEQ